MLVSGDFNGDGNGDLAITNSNFESGTIYILLGNGDGTFQAPVSLTVGNTPKNLVAGDFNGDGKVDLAVTTDDSYSATGHLIVLLGNGDGTFSSSSNSISAGLPSVVVAADYNGDGNLDLAVTTGYAGTLIVYLGNGAGAFTAQSPFAPRVNSSTLNMSGIASRDFNGDGKQDVVFASGYIALGNGDGTFQTPVALPTGGNQYLYSKSYITTEDFNEDGKQDIALSEASGVVILLGNGDGTFQQPRTYAIQTVPGGGPIVVGKFTGSGHVDLIADQLDQSTFSLYAGKGDGTFAGRVLGYANATQGITSGFFVGTGTDEIAAIDSTNNRVLVWPAKEAAVATLSNATFTSAVDQSHQLQCVYAGDANYAGSTSTTISTAAAPTFSPAGGVYTTSQSVALSAPTAGTSVYYTTDGSTPTISSTQYAGPISVSATTTIKALSSGPGFIPSPVVSNTYSIEPFASKPVISPAGGAYSSQQTISITDSLSGAVIHYTLDGSTPTASSPVYSAPFVVSASTVVKAIAIKSGYSNSPVAWSAYSIGQQTTSPTLSATFDSTNGGYSLSCTVSGRTLSGVQGPTGTVTFSDLTTGQTLGTRAIQSFGTPARGFLPTHLFSGSNSTPFTGDFNNDGNPDIVTVSSSGAQIALGKGDGTFQSPSTLAGITLDSFNTAIADFNHDGKLDIASLVSSGGSLSVLVYFGNGDGTFTTSVSTPVASGYQQFLAVGDVNGDGYPDIVLRYPFRGNTYYTRFLNQGDGTFASGSDFYGGLDVSLFTFADLLENGRSDAIVASPSFEQLNVLIANADGSFSSPSTSYNLNFPASYLQAASFRNNGRLDIAATDSNGDIAMFLGNGDGTFVMNNPGHDFNSTALAGIAAEYFDASGNIGLAAVGNDTSGNPVLRVLPGNGDGTFASSLSYTLPESARNLTSADFNGDGFTDLLSSNSQANGSADGISAYMNYLLSSSYGLATQVVIPPGTSPTHYLQCSYSGDSNYASSTSSSISVTLTTANTPQIQPASGPQNTPFSVSFTYPQNYPGEPVPPGLHFYYTTDGSTPTVNSAVYSSPIPVTSATTIKVIAWASGYYPSATATASYTPVVWTPTIAPQSGNYNPPLYVSATDPTPGATIYYTTDGSTPNTSSAIYSGPFRLDSSATVKMLAAYPGFANSSVASAVYTLPPYVPKPVISLQSGHYSGSQTVTITESQSGATIHYTIDGTQPTSASPVYTGPITVKSDTTVQAIAVQSGYLDSAITAAVYTLNGTTSILSASGSDPYSLTCRVAGSKLFSNDGPTGQVTFKDLTNNTSLGTATLGIPRSSLTFRFVAYGATGPSTVLADMNGDGKLDIVSPSGINVGNGDGSFGRLDAIPGFLGGPIAVGDFNGDGKLDVVQWYGNGVLLVALGRGDGTFQYANSYGFATTLESAARPVIATDLNGDGKLDLVFASGTASAPVFAVLLGNGDGTFQSPTTFSSGTSSLNFLVGDFNADGKSDLASVDQSTGKVSVFLGNGDGTFRSAIVTTTSLVAQTSISIAAGDFNKDGHLDLALGGNSQNNVSVLLGNGDGTFQYQPSLTVPLYPLAGLATADINGDGKLDLVMTAVNGSYAPFVAYGNGDGTFTTPATSGQVTVNGTIVLGDINADGAVDIVADENSTYTTLLNSPIDIGQATVANVTVDPGTTSAHSLQCTYAGDANYQGSSSNLVTENYSQLDTPVFSLLVGRYATPQTVTINGSGSGASYYYTTDGSIPTTSSTHYNGPFVITTTTTVKAIATRVGYITSQVSEANYTFAGAPNFSPAPGKYSAPQTVTITDSTPSSTIFYTVDGTTPTPLSTQYSTPVAVPANATLKAIAIAPDHLNSSATSGTYSVPLVSTTTGLKASDVSGAVNQLITLTATVTGTSPSGTVTFLSNGAVLGTAALTSGVATYQAKFTTAGTFAITAQYSGDKVNASSTSNAVSISITRFSTATGLKASDVSGTVNQMITFTATVTGSTPTGTLTFLSNGNTLQTVALTNGVASYQTAFSASGTYLITAQYSGDTFNAPSTSAALSISISPDFSVTGPSGSQTTAPGGTANYSLTFASEGAYSGSLTLGCSGLPAESSCTFEPPVVNLSGSGSQTTTLSIKTTAPSTAMAVPAQHGAPGSPFGYPLALAGIFGILFGTARYRHLGRRLRAAVYPLLLGLVGMTAISACGGGGGGTSGGGHSSDPGTPAGTYAVTVTAADSANKVQHSLKVTLVVN